MKINPVLYGLVGGAIIAPLFSTVIDKAHAQVSVGRDSAYLYDHVSATITATIKTGTGILHSISINTKGATSNTLTVYDNTAASGAVIAVIDTTANVGTLILDVGFNTGLEIVDTAGTAPDVTISYK